MAIGPAGAAGAVGALGLAAGAYVWAGMWPSSQLFGETLVAGRDPAELALTFDDGPNERWTQEILEFLGNYRVKATFFMIGQHARQLGWLARRVREAGHVVGNHTMTHPNLLWSSPRKVREELREANEVLEDVLGERVRFFRPPYGGRRPDVLRAARELELTPVLWNATGYDWRKNTPERIYTNLRRGIERARKAGRGANLLLHDGAPESLEANRAWTSTVVPMVMERMKREGCRFVTVERWAGEMRVE